MKKCVIFKDTFPGLSKTLSFNFQDFSGSKWFSKTFQVLEFSRKKSTTFQKAWEPWIQFRFTAVPKYWSLKSNFQHHIPQRNVPFRTAPYCTVTQQRHERKKLRKHFSAAYFFPLALQRHGNFPFEGRAEAGVAAKNSRKC